MKLEMPLENQVCTLKQARKFDKLGLKLESYFVWAVGGIASTPTIWTLKDGKFNKRLDIIYTFYYAYSSAELEVLLPQRITMDASYRVNLVISKDYDDILAEYEEPVDYSSEIAGEPGKGAHVKADLLIQCLKEGHINPADLSY